LYRLPGTLKIVVKIFEQVHRVEDEVQRLFNVGWIWNAEFRLSVTQLSVKTDIRFVPINNDNHKPQAYVM